MRLLMNQAFAGGWGGGAKTQATPRGRRKVDEIVEGPMYVVWFVKERRRRQQHNTATRGTCLVKLRWSGAARATCRLCLLYIHVLSLARCTSGVLCFLAWSDVTELWVFCVNFVWARLREMRFQETSRGRKVREMMMMTEPKEKRACVTVLYVPLPTCSVLSVRFTFGP